MRFAGCVFSEFETDHHHNHKVSLSKHKKSMFCILLCKKWTPCLNSFQGELHIVVKYFYQIFGKGIYSIDQARSDLTFAYFRPSNVIATIVKIPTLIHLVLPPKKLNIHFSIRLKNEHGNFEEASFEWGRGNQQLQTPVTLQTPSSEIESKRAKIVVSEAFL